ncbi:MAG TPA: cell wall metabolism sensor histidine kinase WalK [Epulopiscium sp.]|nr:cell wall metabolism sensor histidine kinase WalK [Candidatus Epulonipiscium sp.]
MLFSSVLLERMETYYIDKSKSEWLRKANMVASQIHQGNYLKDDSNQTAFMYMLIETGKDKELDARILVINQQGFVVGDSSQADLNRTIINKQVFEALEGRDSAEKQKKDDAMIMSASASIGDRENKDQVIGAVLISASIDDVYKSLDEMKTQTYLLSLLTSIIVALLSFFTSGVIIKPLKTLLVFVQKITNGQLDQKITITGKDEVSELGSAINHMTEQLQRVEQSREEFVSNVSHELKTPLSAVKVLTEALLFQDNVPEEMYKEFFIDINSEVDRLNNIINDLLTLVRLDQKEIPMNINTINLNQMIQAILKRLSPLAKQKSILLTYEGKVEVEAEIDEVKLTLALSNLVENGIKYTPNEGKVHVTLNSDHQDAFISITDTGMGINLDEQSKIFERFYRTDKTRNRETGGTGLGLAITYKTIVMHKGRIKVESEGQNGTKFLVSIPLRHQL